MKIFTYLKQLYNSKDKKIKRRSSKLTQNFLWTNLDRKAIVKSTQLLTMGLTATIILGATTSANASISNFSLTTDSTGTAPFNTNNDPGNDQNANNNIIRTLDIITYQWLYTTDTNNTDNVVITSTLTGDQEWISIPSACIASGSSISPDRKTITCNLGNLPSSQTGQIKVQAKVLGEAPQGSIVTASASISFAPSQTLTSGPVNNIVSAAPKVDLRKTDQNPELIGLRPGPSGEDGLVYSYPLTMVIAQGKGSEPLTGTINITDNITYNNANPVNALLYKGWGTQNDAQNGCNWNGSAAQTGINTETGLATGKLSATPVGQEDRAVSDSGTWTCTQTNPGDPINIQITGADFTGNHAPSKQRNGNSLPANETYLISGVVMLWVPLSDINDAGGSLDLTNTYSELTTISVSNTNNLEPDVTNNATTHTLIAGNGGFNNYYWGSTDSIANSNNLPTLTQKNAGNGLVMPTQNFAKWIIANNNGAIPWQNFLFCDKIDNQTHVVTDLAGQTGNAVNVIVRNTSFSDYIIEYGTGAYNDFTEQRNATCGDSDSPDGWFTSTSAVPGGITAITKVRLRATAEVPATTRFEIGINLTALNTDPNTGQPIPNGTLLANFSAYQTDTLRNGNWQTRNYNPLTHGGSKAFGDRLTLTRAIVRVDKTTSPNDSIDNIQAGDSVDFSLQPSITATVDPAPVQPNVTITDTLPQWLTYQTGSANTPPTTVTVNGDGTTTIFWDLGQQQPNVSLAPITFTTESKFDAPDGTSAVNQVVIESADDASEVDLRTDTRAIIIGLYPLAQLMAIPTLVFDSQQDFLRISQELLILMNEL